MNLVCSQGSIIYHAWKSRSWHSASIASPTAAMYSHPGTGLYIGPWRYCSSRDRPPAFHCDFGDRTDDDIRVDVLGQILNWFRIMCPRSPRQPFPNPGHSEDRWQRCSLYLASGRRRSQMPVLSYSRFRGHPWSDWRDDTAMGVRTGSVQ